MFFSSEKKREETILFQRRGPDTLWSLQAQTYTHVHTFKIQRRMPKNAECLKNKKGGRLRRASLRCKLMTNTCLSCTVHSCISHLGCPRAVGTPSRRAHLVWRDLSGHLRINLSWRRFHDASLLFGPERSAQVLLDHTWLAACVYVLFPRGVRLPFCQRWHPLLRPTV